MIYTTISNALFLQLGSTALVILGWFLGLVIPPLSIYFLIFSPFPSFLLERGHSTPTPNQ